MNGRKASISYSQGSLKSSLGTLIGTMKLVFLTLLIFFGAMIFFSDNLS
jgi:hypothetical protein